MKRDNRSVQGFKQGFNEGYNKGYNNGYDRGWETGIQSGRTHFEGTSIIIPTYNQLEYLEECIESIVAFTNVPYELILIDNGSTDGTVDYLKSLMGHWVQIQLNSVNLGFAGAVNQGLVKARGTTLAILNNDAVVTENWLSNLLYCVQSDPSIGIAAPVTNYISGEQLIDVPYTNTDGMHKFARSYNQSDSSRWKDTNRLTGFCMMWRRDVFERLGYFDEGFEVGNCEDDDYGLRARMLGLRLVISKDTFIHHYGSVSMKTLQSGFNEIYEKNLRYYSSKWGEPQAVLDRIIASSESAVYKMTDFYPTQLAVKGKGSEVYWLEKRKRYLIENAVGIQGVRLSEIDLESWPIEGSISAEEYRIKMSKIVKAQEKGRYREGVLLKIGNQIHQFSGDMLHPLISNHTCEIWFKQQSLVPFELNNKEHSIGMPIISPIIIKADNL